MLDQQVVTKVGITMAQSQQANSKCNIGRAAGIKCPGSGGAASKAIKYWVETRTAAITKQKAGNCTGDKELLVATAGPAQTQNLGFLIAQLTSRWGETMMHTIPRSASMLKLVESLLLHPLRGRCTAHGAQSYLRIKPITPGHTCRW